MAYARKQLGSNADRYVEPEPELGSDGSEEVKDSEVDLSAFLERQRISEPATFSTAPWQEDDGDIDHDLDQTIAWNKGLEEMKREKDAAEAARDLKKRFRAKADKLRGTPTMFKPRKQDNVIVALPLPGEQLQKTPKEEMQDSLDELQG
ncbi:hypothetical protein SCLCIDRAFT_14507 [Scleroderma citrinum Foug A]|uniref:Uncharacterized protein n=1 Tax=Scleroderma citrinum Foug A TaxID=1036808 RepID=A0A0C2ZYL4_9AGAM|nr:hypothetical protein SCLCIDRAFT_14507 [Scleroderma citrinum Foug A]